VFNGGKKEWKRALARHKHRWEDTKLRLKEKVYVYFDRGRALAYLRHYATNRKVAISIPDGFIGIFQ
jgi:hypothetical protein